MSGEGGAQPRYTVAVRELCEFTAKRGDLDLRFTPAPSAQEGIAGHAAVAARRGGDYESEKRLAGSHGDLAVRGRADGWYPARGELEEVKTHRGDVERIPDNHRQLHWAQLKVYGALLCREHGLTEIRLTLVYFNIDSERETAFSERHEADALQVFFEEHCARFAGWADQQLLHREARDAALAAAAFPHPDFHAGQRQLAEAVYRASARGGVLLAQAPTGIGKSIGTLFPALKALAQGKLDRVFYLTAKGSGRALALEAASAMAARPLRLLELLAREKSCEHPDKACHGESCPLARGFYDRLPQARAAALERGRLDQPTLRTVALEHGVCPYYLGQDLARWCDIVVGDYNYWFDSSALLYGLAGVNDWRVAVLVDEAHNLVERGRQMYSAELDQEALACLRAAATGAVRKALDKLHRAWNRMTRDQEREYQAYEALPAALPRALQDVLAALGKHFAEQPLAVDAALQGFYFELLQFQRLAEAFGPHSLFDVRLHAPPTASRTPRSTLTLRNVVPATFLAPRVAAAQALVLFSATLAPAEHHLRLLGLPEDTRRLDVASPFAPEQLEVRLARRISTRWQARSASLAPIADLIAQQYRERPGNYLAFFSSFDYLRQAAASLAERHPDIPLWQQEPRMDEAARAAFVARFTEGGQGVGFAVLGGVFGEGIDLTGARLIGAFVATLGLPQVNPVNEEMRRRLEQLFGAGYEHAYLYPGLTKVVQAAGRVIRSTRDRGTLWLIDDRYGRAEIRTLLPAWWRLG